MNGTSMNGTSKKGSAVVLGISTVILALVILSAYLINVAQRECNSNNNCPEDAYCGSDHECHVFPEQIIVRESNFLPAAFVLGIALITAAWLFRKK